MTTALAVLALTGLLAACSGSGTTTASPDSSPSPLSTVSVSPAASSAASPSPSAPHPTLTVTPAGGVQGGQVIVVTLAGAPPGRDVGLALCAAGPLKGLSHCGRHIDGARKPARTDARGVAVAQLVVAEGELAVGSATCPPCHVRAVDMGSGAVLAHRRLRYLPPGTPLPAAAAAVATPPPAGPLPPGLIPATPATLVGRWVPLTTSTRFGEDRSYVRFRADGTWTGSNRCGGIGNWALGPGGSFRATSAPRTLAHCPDGGAPWWVETAATAAMDGSRLVLFSRFEDSTPELHRLRRA